jgi:ligand-binding SRPBCC domain-containing protein
MLTYRLVSSQVLPVKKERAFAFFEDPGNLCDITPASLDFCILNNDSDSGVYENSEFAYTIKFLGIKMLWRSKIIDYKPPDRFTDIQLKGPYKSWVHVHVLEEVPVSSGILFTSFCHTGKVNEHIPLQGGEDR